MDRLGAEVERELARFGVEAAIGRIVDAWPAAVGETIARNAWPARVGRDGTLHVHTSSSAWAFELTQLTAMILEALAADAPPRLRFAPGPLPEPVSHRGGSDGPTKPPIRPEHEEAARALVAEIGDEELREKVQRAAALSLARAPADRPF
jgi:hypothetical protein